MNNTSSIKTKLISIKHKFWFKLNQHPSCLVFFKIYKTLFNKEFGVTSKKTDIVIEGYPRSANTFTYVAFKSSQKQNYEIAHHVHGISQIIIAIKYGIPTIVLIRKPIEAISSRLVRQPSLEPKIAYQDYINYYNRLLSFTDKFVIGEFNEVIKDFNQTIQKVNLKYGTKFLPFDYRPRNINHCFEIIKDMDKKDQGKNKITHNTLAAPSESRKMLKYNLINKLANDESLKPLIAQADSIYYAFLNKNN